MTRHITTLTMPAIMIALLSACSSQHPPHPADVTDGNDLFGRNGHPSAPITTHAVNQSIDQFNVEMAAGPHEGLLAMRRFYFDYDSDKLNPKCLPALQAHANYLKRHPNAKVLLEGNTDARGSRNYNLALGQRRADAVATQLKAYGISPQQVSTISYGKERPIALGNDAAAYAKNRRTDLIYVSRY